MKILIFNFEYPPLGGGGGIATKYIAEELAPSHEVHVITSRPSRKFKDWSDHCPSSAPVVNGVYIHRVPVWGRTSLAVASLVSMITFVPSAWWKARKMVKEYNFDVINAQFVIPSGVPAGWISRRYRIPMVLSFIGGDLFDPTKGVSPHRHWILRKIVKVISNQATVCTAISHDTKRRAVDIHKVTKEIVVINLGIVAKAHTGHKTRRELGLPEGVPLFVSLGRLIPRKGYGCLLEALAKATKAHLAIMGDGPLLDNLKKKAYDLGVSERMHWLGYVSEEDKINILDVADGFISASEHEGFGIVFLEAMESGLPIIGTWEGGQTDFLVHERNALLVPPKNAQAMADGMNRLMGDHKLGQKMGEINRQEVQGFYWPRVGKRYEEVLQSCLQEHKASTVGETI
jgi:glycosyltransferase involved in cell wall biosynthesis